MGAFAITPRPFRSPLYPFENDNIAKVLHIEVRLDDWVARCAFFNLVPRAFPYLQGKSPGNEVVPSFDTSQVVDFTLSWFLLIIVPFRFYFARSQCKLRINKI